MRAGVLSLGASLLKTERCQRGKHNVVVYRSAPALFQYLRLQLNRLDLVNVSISFRVQPERSVCAFQSNPALNACIRCGRTSASTERLIFPIVNFKRIFPRISSGDPSSNLWGQNELFLSVELHSCG